MELWRRTKAMFGARGIPDGMDERVPAGQYVTPKQPVMNMGFAAKISTGDWSLEVTGLVDNPLTLRWPDFEALAYQQEIADFHCVTQWSRLNVAWEGVPIMNVLDLVGLKPDARYVMFHCGDGYTTNVDIEALRSPNVLFAHRMDGRPLEVNHGYPVRVVIPQRYGWKSAKWVTGVDVMADDRPGFWEMNGYHMRGDPWREERFSHA